MPTQLRVFAGDCTTIVEGSRDRTQRGRVVVLIKPDNTTLVHDADGYQPVAWLTRPEAVTVEADAGGFTITARDAESTLRVVSHDATAARDLPVTPAGIPVGTCPDCGAPLVRTGGTVGCLGCETRHGLPAGATVTDRRCEDCGLPEIRVERGEAVRVCLDVSCEALADVVADRFDGAWDCPDCGGALDVQQATGRTFLGCSNYPDCETTFSFPAGVVVDDCPCGLPVFETSAGRRCLDGTCDRSRASTDGGHDRDRDDTADRGDDHGTDADRGDNHGAGHAATDTVEEYVSGSCPRLTGDTDGDEDS